MNWTDWLVIGLWTTAYVALWLSGRFRAKAFYWTGRQQEIEAQIELQEGGPMAYLLKVRVQLAEVVGEKAAQQFVDTLQIEWVEPDDGP